VVIKILLLLLFFAITIFVGIYFRKRASSVAGFVLAGRSVGPWLSAFAYGASYFSAVVFIGYAGKFGWEFGTAAVWIGLGNAFIGSLLAWVILGRRTRIMTGHLKSTTMPEFFGIRYNSKWLKIGAAVIVFVFLIPYTAALYNGLSLLFSMAFNIDFIYCVIGMAIITAIYVVAGGYFATAVNDFIQGIIMIVGIVAVVAAVLNDNGGFTAAITSLANITDPSVAPGVFTSFFGPEPFNLLCVVVLTSFGAWGMPQMVAKFYSIKSEKAISRGMVISTVFALIVAGGCYFLGSFGRLYASEVLYNTNGTPLYDSIVPTMLSKFPDIMVGGIIVLVFAASISTLSSLVMSSSSTLTLDFIRGHVVKKMDNRQTLFSVRFLIVVFIILSVVIAAIQDKYRFSYIADLMGVSWGALAGSFLGPFLFGLYWKRTSKISVWCCFVFSVGLMVSNILFRNSFPEFLRSPINSGALAIVSGFVIVPVVSWLTKAPAKEHIEKCYSFSEETASVAVSNGSGNAVKPMPK